MASMSPLDAPGVGPRAQVRGYIVACDVGTSGIKTCLYRLGTQDPGDRAGGAAPSSQMDSRRGSDRGCAQTDALAALTLVAAASAGYGLFTLPDGGAEQDPEQLWAAMCATTRQVIADSGVAPGAVRGISFCSQMQSLVLVDRDGAPVRRTMSYMDQRAGEELRRGFGSGVTVQGMNARKLAAALRITGAAPASVKDPVWKYAWVRAHEPEVFARVHKWLDIKEFLILRCTGEFVMTPDSAFGTLLYDPRPNHRRFSEQLCDLFGVDPSHLPRLVRGTDRVGPLTPSAATALGLVADTPVFGGGGDASLIGIGAGASHPGATHIYSGTSGWVSTVVKDRAVDITTMIAAIVGAEDGTYHYFAELETAGKCLEWVRDHLALDEINLYLSKIPRTDGGSAGPAGAAVPTGTAMSLEARARTMYDFMLEEIQDVPPGSNGVIFTPWLHGNRCPFEDPNAAGMFVNLRLETGKREMIHAVLEGICYHLRWQLEASEKKVRTSRIIRFVGGGALAPLTCQLLADILGREVQTVADPQNVGALGAAVLAAVGLGAMSRIEDADRMVTPSQIYYPDPTVKGVHDRNFRVFQQLYHANRDIFRTLNGARPAQPGRPRP